MNDEPPMSEHIARLEERMKTLKAENETAFERLRADMAKRDKDNQRWIVGLVLGCTAIVVGAIALL